MAKFGQASRDNLQGVHPLLVQICAMAVEIMDFVVLDGVRTLEQSQINAARGVSRLKDPSKSKHIPQADGFGHAVDLAPYPVNWKDTEMFCVLAGVMLACAHRLGAQIRWGGDWSMDFSTTDEKFRDYGHFELITSEVVLRAGVPA